MINPKELRLGNIIMDIVSSEWMVVDDIGANVGAVLINRDKFPLAPGWQMGPVPLTPEVLVRCGFENTRLFAIVWHNFIKRYVVVVHGGPIQYELLHLHQFQNLYYALTGEELTVTT